MTRSSFMRIVLVVGSVLILVGVGLMTWMLVTEDERNNIVVDLFDDDPDSLKFESLSLVPGQECEYNVRLKSEHSKTYDLEFDFVDLGEGTLKNFARVKVIANGNVVCDELLADAMEDDNIVFPVDFKANDKNEIKIVYYLPLDVGNEAKKAEAQFELVLTASNE